MSETAATDTNLPEKPLPSCIEKCFDAPLRGEGHLPRWFSYVVFVVASVVLKLCFRYKIEGREVLDSFPEGSVAVIAGNHASLVDPVFLLLIAKLNIRYMAKEELFKDHHVLGWLLAHMGAFPVKRESADRRAIMRSVRALKRGEFLGIFPEGTRRKSADEVLPNHAGAVLIAQMAGVPIIPMGIEGTDRIKPAGARFLHFPKITIRFGAPIDPADYKELPKNERAQIIVDEVMREVFALRDGLECENLLPKDAS